MNKILDFSPPVEIEIPGRSMAVVSRIFPTGKNKFIRCSGGQTFTS